MHSTRFLSLFTLYIYSALLFTIWIQCRPSQDASPSSVNTPLTYVTGVPRGVSSPARTPGVEVSPTDCSTSCSMGLNSPPIANFQRGGRFPISSCNLQPGISAGTRGTRSVAAYPPRMLRGYRHTAPMVKLPSNALRYAFFCLGHLLVANQTR